MVWKIQQCRDDWVGAVPTMTESHEDKLFLPKNRDMAAICNLCWFRDHTYVYIYTHKQIYGWINKQVYIHMHIIYIYIRTYIYIVSNPTAHQALTPKPLGGQAPGGFCHSRAAFFWHVVRTSCQFMLAATSSTLLYTLPKKHPRSQHATEGWRDHRRLAKAPEVDADSLWFGLRFRV